MSKDRKPRFNHVAMSLPTSQLDDTGRADLLEFYGDVFGWTEHAELTEPGKRLVMMCNTFEQFVFLLGNDKTPTTGAKMDHFGLSVGTEEEFEDVLGRAQKWVEKDSQATEVIGPIDEFYGPLRMRSFYVKHALPLMTEIQWWDWASLKGFVPDVAAAEGHNEEKVAVPQLD